MQTRESGVELLRILLMFMIIIHHFIVHGSGLAYIPAMEHYVEQPRDAFYIFLNSFVTVAVSTFVFISAYFGLKFKTKKILSLVVQAIFYSVFIYLICCFLGLAHWSIADLYRSFIPILSVRWWFLSVYMVLYILSPILNKGIAGLDKKQHLFIMVVLLLMMSSYFITNFTAASMATFGHAVLNFITVYITGQYFRKYNLEIKRSWILYFASTLCLFGIVLFYFRIFSPQLAITIFSSNPLLLFAAICLFFSFKNLKFKNTLVNRISPLAFGVYLIHDSNEIREVLKRMIMKFNALDYPIYTWFVCILGMGAGIFIICILIEYIRQLICSPLLKKLENTNFINRLDIWK